MIHNRFLAGMIGGACFLCACVVRAETQFEQDCARLVADSRGDDERLQSLLRLDWEYTMRESPEFATEVGYPGQNARWSDLSPDSIERHKRELLAPLKVVESLSRSRLSVANQLNYDLYKRNLEEAIEGSRFKDEYLLITPLSGVQIRPQQTLDSSPRAKVQDYEDMIARLNALPTLIDQNIFLLRKGVAAGIMPPRITLRDVPDQVKSQMTADPDKNSLLQPFLEFPQTIAATDRERLRQQAIEALRQRVVPAYARLHEFLVKEYLPGARESIAFTDVPDGPAWYAYKIRVETTTGLSPKQIHELGLAEVKRIRTEMDKVILQTGFKGSFGEFLDFLRTEPRFYYTNANDLITGYRDICKRADPELAHLFGRMPRLTYGVKPVPAYSEKSQTTAYYQPGAPDAGRPGYYFANTYALNTRPKWEMEALSLHESVPGHHFQIALAQELEGIPDFRKHGRYTGFVEGWGLYSESLGPEMGFYKDPYMKFGQLVYEMWRAIRLVVDTGMHSMGWTREQAIDYFLANAAKTKHDITVEVDRYISWPGQALAYKIGELKLKELRAYATTELGGAFDVRQFHDVILGQGALPLETLETRVKEWVKSKQASKP